MVLSDNQKIGIGLITIGLGFLMLGCLMLFDRAMLAIGNILFFAQLYSAIILILLSCKCIVDRLYIYYLIISCTNGWPGILVHWLVLTSNFV